jgi:hypothetical protein
MSLKKSSEVIVTVRESGHMEVRRSGVIKENGVEIARTNHRHVVGPTDALDEQDALVKKIGLAIRAK